MWPVLPILACVVIGGDRARRDTYYEARVKVGLA